ncbi:MAG TPA: hypothetical protein DD408_07740 [Rheinheimera sp.]|nr:hypothetical protein [Rheinheimera sp.]
MKKPGLIQTTAGDDLQQDPLPAYTNRLSRRDSLKLLAALAASTLLPALPGCEPVPTATKTGNATGTEHWPELKLPAIDAKGYGKDPNLIMPPEAPWPLTLTAAQLTMLAQLADIVVPAEGNSPSASQVQVPSVVDEWVSAPYPSQQRDRLTILSALAWIDDEAKLRFDSPFTALTAIEQLAIVDDIAYDNENTPLQFQRIAKAFARLRNLVLAAYFCTPEGIKDIGYLGNVPIAGAYPGPTAEAYAHLDNTLAQLGLTEFAYPVA